MSLAAVGTLWQRELVRFYRDRARVIGGLTPPIVFWFLLGSGLGRSFRVPGTAGELDFLQYFFSGTLVLIVLFTSVFATISVIEDRREGFLQAVLVSPAPRLAIVLGKVLGASTVGLLQGLCFLALAPWAGVSAGPGALLQAVAVLSLASVGLTGLGFLIAWRLDSTQGFHSVMNLFLIPMWMLSGALFPAASAPPWLKAVMKVNPVGYAVSGLQQALVPASGLPGLPPFPACLAALALFAAAALAACVWEAGRTAEG